ncbi:MAG: alpha-L-fucosidase [Verrucomicrobiae bacterium]|nr:alpha-L-fucosidase [Verrucomicrobiae bacterium]
MRPPMPRSIIPPGAMLAGLWISALAAAAPPPAPHGPAPSRRQVEWHALEFYGFLHFTVNTFTDKEWGYGDESPEIFNPTDFDADAIARVARDAGMRGLILTCKHHDGFCLWPSKFTDHSIKKSPWRGGKGDVVREVSDACKRHGLLFGTYLSPWDRNHPEYARPAYVEYYRNQLRELLTQYGTLFEVWFDGANGGDGYYGGARERRQIAADYYGWEENYRIVRELQPLATMFSGPDIRWVGNEAGIAGDPCWSTFNRDASQAEAAYRDRLNRGDRPGTEWWPAECDVSIRPGWFYHAAEDNRVRSPENLVDLYFKSVGRGASLLLNLPPDRRGRIHENDIASLRGFRKIIDSIFGTDLAGGSRASASSVRGDDPRFAAGNATDGSRDTYWCSDDRTLTPELVLDLAKPTTFNVVSLREFLPLGQRVDTWALDRWADGRWEEFGKGAAIGNRRLWRGADVTTDRVRLRITAAAACPAISEIALHREPAEVRTAATQQAATEGMPKTGWRAIAATSQCPGHEAARAIDGDPKTLWQAAAGGDGAPPQDLTLDLGKATRIRGIIYVPRTDGKSAGLVDKFQVFVSPDGKDWGEPVASGEFANMLANPIVQEARVEPAANARFLRFRVLHTADGQPPTAAEIGLPLR